MWFADFCKGGLGDEGLDLKNLLNVCPVSTTENFVVTGHSYNDLATYLEVLILAYTQTVFAPLMSSSSMASASKFPLEDHDPEERKALLPSGSADSEPDNIEDKDGWSTRRISLTALVLIILLITGAFTALLVLGGYPGRKGQPAASSILRSNGTHEFKPTVLIVSIDGLRSVPLRQKIGSMYRI